MNFGKLKQLIDFALAVGATEASRLADCPIVIRAFVGSQVEQS